MRLQRQFPAPRSLMLVVAACLGSSLVPSSALAQAPEQLDPEDDATLIHRHAPGNDAGPESRLRFTCPGGADKWVVLQARSADTLATATSFRANGALTDTPRARPDGTCAVPFITGGRWFWQVRHRVEEQAPSGVRSYWGATATTLNTSQNVDYLRARSTSHRTQFGFVMGVRGGQAVKFDLRITRGCDGGRCDRRELIMERVPQKLFAGSGFQESCGFGPDEVDGTPVLRKNLASGATSASFSVSQPAGADHTYCVWQEDSLGGRMVFRSLYRFPLHTIGAFESLRVAARMSGRTSTLEAIGTCRRSSGPAKCFGRGTANLSDGNLYYEKRVGGRWVLLSKRSTSVTSGGFRLSCLPRLSRFSVCRGDRVRVRYVPRARSLLAPKVSAVSKVR